MVEDPTLRLAKRLLLGKAGTPIPEGDVELYPGEVPEEFPFAVPAEFQAPVAQVLGTMKLHSRYAFAPAESVSWECLVQTSATWDEAALALRKALTAQGWGDYAPPGSSSALGWGGGRSGSGAPLPFERPTFPPEIAGQRPEVGETQSFGRGTDLLTVSLSPHAGGVELHLSWSNPQLMGGFDGPQTALEMPLLPPPPGCRIQERGRTWSDTLVEVEAFLDGPITAPKASSHFAGVLAAAGWQRTGGETPLLGDTRWSQWTLSSERPQHLRLTLRANGGGNLSLVLKLALAPDQLKAGAMPLVRNEVHVMVRADDLKKL